jgi:hypothetical protein
VVPVGVRVDETLAAADEPDAAWVSASSWVSSWSVSGSSMRKVCPGRHARVRQRSRMYLGARPDGSASRLCRRLRALCPQEVLYESPYDRGHGESMFGAPRFERGVLFLWQSNGERLMLAARRNDRHLRPHEFHCCGCRVPTYCCFQGSGWLSVTKPEVKPRSEQKPDNDGPIPLGKPVEGLMDESSRPLALRDRPSHITMISLDITHV